MTRPRIGPNEKTLILALIKEVQKNKILWDTISPEFKMTRASRTDNQKAVWQLIGLHLAATYNRRISADDCESAWKRERTKYLRGLKGIGPQYSLAEEISFIKDHCKTYKRRSGPPERHSADQADQPIKRRNSDDATTRDASVAGTSAEVSRDDDDGSMSCHYVTDVSDEDETPESTTRRSRSRSVTRRRGRSLSVASRRDRSRSVASRRSRAATPLPHSTRSNVDDEDDKDKMIAELYNKIKMREGKDEDRTKLFNASIQPYLSTFNDDEMSTYNCEVWKLINSIIKQRKTST